MILKNIWVPISGALAQQKKVETIANNIANANTPGFKKDNLVFKEYLTALDKGYQDTHLPRKEWAPEDFYKSYDAENSLVKTDGSYTDFRQGQLTPTGNPFDIAINGKGFFEVLTSNGIRYTRKGTFTLRKDGTLITDSGFPVLRKLIISSTNKDTKLPPPGTRTINVGQGNITINLNGEIFNNNNKISDLSVIEFKDIHALKKEGNSLFINQHIENIIPNANKSVVHQGFIEQSNVNPVSEMSSLIKANRHFESIQRAIKAYDNITGKAVNEISKF